MSNQDDLYEGEAKAILRKRFLFHTDNNYCAAFILDRFVAEIATRIERAWFQETQPDYYITYSLRSITDSLFGLFEYEQVAIALNLLIEKEYIYTTGKVEGTSDSYQFFINKPRIDVVSEEYRKPFLLARIEAERANPLPPLPQITPEEAAKTEISREEVRVEQHVRRAKDVGLEATLTIDQWIQTLTYFDWQCAYCNGDFELLEHFIPINHEGGTTHLNCVPSCKVCNAVKKGWHPSRVPSAKRHKYAQKTQVVLDGIERVQKYFEACRNEVEQDA